MKVFFDTNFYVSEALLGSAAEQMLDATQKASWRIYTSVYVADELQRVLTTQFDLSPRFAFLSRKRVLRRGIVVEPRESRHSVPEDPADSPILRAALEASVDYLVTNDSHLLSLSPYEGLRIVSMSDYHRLLAERGLL